MSPRLPTLRCSFASNRLVPVVASCVLLAGLPGCALLDLRQSGQEQQSHGAVAVAVDRPPGRGVTYAVALGTRGVLGAEVVPADGVAAFLVPVGAPVDVAAFQDRNGNRRRDPGEPAGILQGIPPEPLSDVSYRGAVHPLTLSPAASGLPAGLAVPSGRTADAEALPVNLGEVVRLGDPRFTAANGTLGFWQPYEFLARLGWGIYFLEPYDPNRIPVVFVYGIDGSPQDGKSLLAALDRRKFQPWFFHYPSGLRLEKSANGLSRALQLLRARYRFPQVIVVAHSMGGLVARGAIQQAAAESGGSFVPKFVSLCSPWGGDSEADSGVRHLRYPVPAWIDMQPGSAYLKRLFARPLPAGTRHYLIFDFQTHRAPWLKPDNDGAVQVASELFPPAQAEATAMFGFPYAHVETLGKPDVHARVNAYLAAP